jgi:hypothetical protein
MHLSGLKTFHNNEGVEVAFRAGLRIRHTDFYSDAVFKIVPRWGRRISVLGDWAVW